MTLRCPACGSLRTEAAQVHPDPRFAVLHTCQDCDEAYWGVSAEYAMTLQKAPAMTPPIPLLAHLRSLLDAATPRPWVWDEDGWFMSGPPTELDSANGWSPQAIIQTDCSVYGPEPADRALIAALVNAAPLLIDLAEAVATLDDAGSWGPERVRYALDALRKARP